MAKLIDLTGQRFHKWTVLERDFEKQKELNTEKTYWKCKCDCGTERSVCGCSLKRGTS